MAKSLVVILALVASLSLPLQAGTIYAGSITDPTGDNPTGPDITGATASLANGLVNLTVYFVPSTLTSSTRVEINIDRNQNGLDDMAVYLQWPMFGADAAITDVNYAADPIPACCWGFTQTLESSSNSLGISFPAERLPWYDITGPFTVQWVYADSGAGTGSDITGSFPLNEVVPEPGTFALMLVPAFTLLVMWLRRDRFSLLKSNQPKLG